MVWNALRMSPAAEESGTFEVILAPASERFDAADERWLEQVSLLFQELQRGIGGVTRRSAPVSGTKGGAEVVVLALGSAGAFTVGLEMLRSWLGRDRCRRLDISYTVSGHTETVAISGDAIDKDAMAKLTAAISTRLSSAPWTGTAPS